MALIAAPQHFPGCTLKIGVAGTEAVGAATEVAKLVSISGVGGTRDKLDYTHTSSSNDDREYRRGLKTPNEINVTMRYMHQESSAAQTLLFDDFDANIGTTNPIFYIVMDDGGAASSGNLNFRGYVGSWSASGSINDTDPIMLEATLVVTGGLTVVDGADA